ncbi:TDT family transporter [Vagococcus vulneris]|uniref:C4-dicarboxylate ABC transporter n=1 Tax=Vagococcus vulneris TaxID=1977869 RepID=A0A430A1H2_9ENTE|nr:TDT family transporter [Vagococcus vulneris]RSU00222.1 hypothetical protein CBF37_02690 [Vagococcus vulneris]
MKTILAKTPLPISAVGLSCIGLATLTQPLKIIHYLFLILGSLILCGTLLKILFNINNFKQQMQKLPIAATFPTLFMGLSFLSVYIININYLLARFIWLFAVICHAVFIIYFSYRYGKKSNLSKILPSWFIVYVGIVASGITAPQFGFDRIGKIITVFGIISFIILIILIFQRLRSYPIPKDLQCTFAIMAAPASLNFVGYYANFKPYSLIAVICQLLIVVILYLVVLSKMWYLIKLPFSPAKSGLTFPMVISATAVKKTGIFLGLQHPTLSLLFSFISFIMILFAACIVLWVLYNYIITIKKNNTKSNKHYTETK